MSEASPSTYNSPIDKIVQMRAESSTEIQSQQDETRNRDTQASPEPPSDNDIANFLSHLKPKEKRQYDRLRELGWKDPSLYNFFTALRSNRTFIIARLRKAGVDEEEIERRDKLYHEDTTTDYSDLKGPLASESEGDRQLQLYLLEEIQRQIWGMTELRPKK